jgi:hypothetical protein
VAHYLDHLALAHYLAHDAVQTSPGAWRHRHPHTHRRPDAHQGLLASWYTPDQGHQHSHFPARPDVEQHHRAGDVGDAGDPDHPDHNSPTPADSS